MAVPVWHCRLSNVGIAVTIREHLLVGRAVLQYLHACCCPANQSSHCLNRKKNTPPPHSYGSIPCHPWVPGISCTSTLHLHLLATYTRSLQGAALIRGFSQLYVDSGMLWQLIWLEHFIRSSIWTYAGLLHGDMLRKSTPHQHRVVDTNGHPRASRDAQKSRTPMKTQSCFLNPCRMCCCSCAWIVPSASSRTLDK